jgi:hypothetical protein
MKLDAQEEYDNLVTDMEASGEAKASKMFGMPCLMNEKGKAFAGFFNGFVTFKLPEDTVKGWLKNKGAKNFDPGSGRPMKEWLQLPADYAEYWPEIAKEALEYVNSLKK